MEDRVPSYQNLEVPIVQALQELGGQATKSEIVRKVAQILGLSEATICQPHNSAKKTTETELGYRIGWAHHYLKRYGITVGYKRGTYKLNDDYLHANIDLVKNKIKESR
jgi:restriction endonuclease Mrr